MRTHKKKFETKEAANERAFNVAVSYPEHKVTRSGNEVVVIENYNTPSNINNRYIRKF